MSIDLNIIVRGHFRSFDKTHKSLHKSLQDTSHSIYMHTWDKIDSDTPNLYNRYSSNTELTQEHQSLLRTFDKDCVMESQVWSEEELQNIVLTRPYKVLLYFWQGIHSGLNRMHENSRHILITRYDIEIDINFHEITCEEDEIVIGYGMRYPSDVFLYGVTDVIFLINYKDKHKLVSIPQEIIESQTPNSRYQLAEDPITDFFYKNWKKVTPLWKIGKDFNIVRP